MPQPMPVARPPALSAIRQATPVLVPTPWSSERSTAARTFPRFGFVGSKVERMREAVRGGRLRKTALRWIAGCSGSLGRLAFCEDTVSHAPAHC